MADEANHVRIGLSPKRDLSPEVVVAGLESILQGRDQAFNAAHPPRWYDRFQAYLPPILAAKLNGKKPKQPALGEEDIRPWFEPYQDPHQVLKLGEEIHARGLKLDEAAEAYIRDQNKKAIQISEGLSYLDNLTRLANRRRLMERLETNIHAYEAKSAGRELRRHGKNTGQYLSIIVADIDNFKKEVNDKLGYQEGDHAIRWVADRLKRVRPSDLAARYGGEEFVVACPETSRSSVEKLAERMRKDIEENSIKELGYQLTVSLGTATYDIDASNAKDLLIAGFRAAYVAKKGSGGKNRVVPMRQRVLRDYYEILDKNGENGIAVT